MRVPGLLLLFSLAALAAAPGTPEGKAPKAREELAPEAHLPLSGLAEWEKAPNAREEMARSSRNMGQADRTPRISPDYIGVTIPPNIAPMNFVIEEEGISFEVSATSGSGEYRLDLSSSDGVVRFPEDSWKELARESTGDSIIFKITASNGEEGQEEEFESFSMHVAREEVDPWLVYRLIHPGYYSWSRIKIVQRSLESFEEEAILDNQILENNCANCHTFNRNSPERYLIHVRGSLGGTYFVEDGEITRVEPRIDAMPGGATYPAWHPDGRFLAFSSNQVRQSFYSQPGKAVEVYDLASSLILYDRDTNEVLPLTDDATGALLRTFPEWSADGRYLYFSQAPQVIDFDNPELDQIKRTRYDIVRKPFDAGSRSFGVTEMVFDASGINKSASFPRVSPDGKFMVSTVADYGTFPIWHREADLFLHDLTTGEHRRMDINSDETDSYHTWSANGRWLVFSSRRLDGRSTRSYFAHIDSQGNQGKEFVLPQEDPTLYDRMLMSFNRPVLATGRIEEGPRDFLKASKQETLRARSGGAPDPFPIPSDPGRELQGPEGLSHD